MNRVSIYLVLIFLIFTNITNAQESISGSIICTNNQPMDSVTVILSIVNSDQQVIQNLDTTFTDTLGMYSFTELDTGVSYAIRAELTADTTAAGISIFDLLILSRALNDQQELSPFQAIAADFNQNGKVSVTDMIQLRSFLLSIDQWRKPEWIFVSEDLDASNLIIPDLSKSMDGVLLIGIKTGDINSTACPVSE